MEGEAGATLRASRGGGDTMSQTNNKNNHSVNFYIRNSIKNTISAIQAGDDEDSNFIRGKEDTELTPVLEAESRGL